MFIFPGGSSKYKIQNSLRFRASASAYLSRTASTGSQTTCTWSGWLKRTPGIHQVCFSSGPTSIDVSWFQIGSDNVASIVNYVGGVFQANAQTAAVFRDSSAWYHFVFVWDTTNATAADRCRIYVNGVRQTLTFSATPPQNNTAFFGGGTHIIGKDGRASQTNYFDGYLAEVNFIDGQALDPSSFGQTDPVTGQWIAKKYTGAYGTNGFYLPFSDGSSLTNLCADKSGNGNNWTATNVSLTAGTSYDWMLDVPSGNGWADGGNGRGNYCVFNPLAASGGGTVFSGANLDSSAASGATRSATATIAASSGQWYFEVTPTSNGGELYVGVVEVDSVTYYTYRGASGNKYTNSGNAAYGAAFTTNDVIGIALDLSAATVTFYKNGVSQGVAYSGIVAGAYTVQTIYNGTAASSASLNCGQRPFAYTPPAGFKALHTGNLPAPTINKPSLHFNTVLDTGANIKTTAESQYTYFLEWIKDRANVNNHQLADTVRGTANILQSNTTAAETTYSAPAGSSVGWVWNAGSAAASNTAGSITSQVSANTTAGISVVTYTGNGANATVGHGLGVAPKMIIAKGRGAVHDWDVYHASIGATGAVLLNLTNATVTTSAYWNNTSPTSSVFTVSATNGDINVNGVANVAYCFAEIPGFSKFGSYVGNGSADGPFMYCGFRPRFVLIKNAAISSNWAIWDTARSTYNQVQDYLLPNLSAAEANASSVSIDVTAAGFKLRGIDSGINGSGNTIIFAAFAESPFNFSNAR